MLHKDGGYREIPGSFNSYSGDFPLWRLSYTIIPYIREKFEHIGLSFQSLFNMPKGMEVPFLTYQQFSNLIGSVVPMIVKEQNWQPMIDTIWATRDETDYDFRNSLVKKEFMRKWSHSRTSVDAMLSLDQLMDDAPDSITFENAPFADEPIRHELINGYLNLDELRLINEQIKDNMRKHQPYIINAAHSTDIICNLYSHKDQLAGWFVATGGGYAEHIESRLQLAQAFCSLMDLWVKINMKDNFHENLFLDVLEMRETDASIIQLRLEGIGWGGYPEMQLGVLEPCAGDILGITVISRYLENNYKGVQGFYYQERFIIVINFQLVDKKCFLEDLRIILESQNALCGFSYCFHTLEKLPQSTLQAFCALKCCLKKPGSLNFCEKYAVEYLIMNEKEFILCCHIFCVMYKAIIGVCNLNSLEEAEK